MNYALRCKCGAIQGHADTDHSAGRAVCYCKDCQAFARFLGRDVEILDAQGGTEIVALPPAAVHFTAGQEKIACMSLSPKGLLRWYSDCCKTAIANTPRDMKLPYVGLLSDCLPGSEAERAEAFGSAGIALNTESARGEVKTTPVATFFGVARIMKNVFIARLSGRYRQNPFFDLASGIPVKAPQVLSLEERNAFRNLG